LLLFFESKLGKLIFNTLRWGPASESINYRDQVKQLAQSRTMAAHVDDIYLLVALRKLVCISKNSPHLVIKLNINTKCLLQNTQINEIINQTLPAYYFQ
jgi:hypothetical protein